MPDTMERKMIKARGSLPPLALLEVGEEIKGEILTVDIQKMDVQEKVKGKLVKREKIRIFYRIQLDEMADIHGGRKNTATGKYDVQKFEKGQVVSLPGAGGLDTTFGDIALKIEGKTADDEPNFHALEGRYVEVKREADDVMKSGPWKGNKVKVYAVQYAA